MGSSGSWRIRPLTAKTRVRTPLGPPGLPEPREGAFSSPAVTYSARGSKPGFRRPIREEKRPGFRLRVRKPGRPSARDARPEHGGEPRWDRHSIKSVGYGPFRHLLSRQKKSSPTASPTPATGSAVCLRMASSTRKTLFQLDKNSGGHSIKRSSTDVQVETVTFALFRAMDFRCADRRRSGRSDIL